MISSGTRTILRLCFILKIVVLGQRGLVAKEVAEDFLLVGLIGLFSLLVLLFYLLESVIVVCIVLTSFSALSLLELSL